jgi:hypothetical protein
MIAENILQFHADLKQSLYYEKSDPTSFLGLPTLTRLDPICWKLTKYIGKNAPCPSALNIKVVGTVGNCICAIHILPGFALDRSCFSSALNRLLTYEIPFGISLAFLHVGQTETRCELRLTGNDHPDASVLSKCVIEHAAELACSIRAGNLDAYVESDGDTTRFMEFSWSPRSKGFSIVTHITEDTRPADLELQLKLKIEVLSVAAQDLLVI